MNAQTERLLLQGPAGAIEVLRDEPAPGTAPRGTAIIAHPHPLFGGTMDNKVVQTLARAFVQCGWRAIRFNFRGVGASAGAHDEGRGETEDFLAVVEQCASEGPLALAGFSFGSYVMSRALSRLAPARQIEALVYVGAAASRFEVLVVPPELHERTLVVHGEHDDTVSLAAVMDWARPQVLPQPPEIAARAYLLVDVTANQILAAKEVDAPVEPASLTKLMTAYLVFDALRLKKIDLKQTLPVSERAWRMPGSRMFIDPKMKVPVEDLIKGMIVQSGNDATVALAEGVGGTVERFVQLMNEQAKALGMKSTSYKNPEGLTEPGHTTTARDLATLALRLMRDFPEYVPYYAIKKYRYEGTPAANDSNRNLLLFRDPSVDGLKTGHTEAAGYCLIATARRDFPNLGAPGAAPGSPAASGSRRLLSIVLGTSSESARASESQKLLNWGYTAYDAVKLFDAGQPVVTPAIWKGRASQARLGQPQAIVVAVPAGNATALKTEVARADPLVAPLRQGQQAALLKVMLGERLLVNIPLLALEDVEQAGVLGRAWDAVRMWIK